MPDEQLSTSDGEQSQNERKKRKKRKASSSISNGTQKEVQSPLDPPPASIKVLLKPLEGNFNSRNFPMNFSNFSLLMDMVNGKNDVLPKIQDFGIDPKDIIYILKENYLLLTHRSMKIRFTRFKNRILKQAPELKQIDDLSEESDLSDSLTK